jgi:hypothetical protein
MAHMVVNLSSKPYMDRTTIIISEAFPLIYDIFKNRKEEDSVPYRI